jgi:DNA-binding NtrC family response regulator
MPPTQLFGTSPHIRQINEDALWAARSDAKVLLTGESGVGKEVVARLIHERSSRCRQPLVTINCAGVPDTLLASELFGHMRGSFTDAHRDRAGWLEQAHRGTIFFDEVGEMSLQMQAALLRFLESGEIQRVGSEARPSKVDVRVVCATNRNLLERVQSGDFREDLYYRLNVIHIAIPPLRHRPEDVEHLLRHYMDAFARLHRLPVPEVGEDAMTILLNYRWPGNVRELRNLAERLIVRWREGQIRPEDLPDTITGLRPAVGAAAATVGSTSRAQMLVDKMARGQDFWSAVHSSFISRDITREDLRGVIRLGLTLTRGNYRSLVKQFNMPEADYKRFLTFLRKHHAHLPVHEFRAPVLHREQTPMIPTWPESQALALA